MRAKSLIIAGVSAALCFAGPATTAWAAEDGAACVLDGALEKAQQDAIEEAKATFLEENGEEWVEGNENFDTAEKWQAALDDAQNEAKDGAEAAEDGLYSSISEGCETPEDYAKIKEDAEKPAPLVKGTTDGNSVVTSELKWATIGSDAGDDKIWSNTGDAVTVGSDADAGRIWAANGYAVVPGSPVDADNKCLGVWGDDGYAEVSAELAKECEAPKPPVDEEEDDKTPTPSAPNTNISINNDNTNVNINANGSSADCTTSCNTSTSTSTSTTSTSRSTSTTTYWFIDTETLYRSGTLTLPPRTGANL